MFSDRFTYLIMKEFSSVLTPEEKAELQACRNLPENEEIYQQLKYFWNEKNEHQVPDIEKALQQVMGTIEQEQVTTVQKVTPVRSLRISYWVAAAVLLIVVTTALFFLTKKTSHDSLIATEFQGSKNGFVEKQNAKGTRSIIVLADGSKVWLNADSRLQYPSSFEGTTREVSLSGEAFFEVSKNKLKPFIIHLKNGTVRVVGTSFNIKAYDNSPLIETSVATGKVAFIPTKSSSGKKVDTVFLTPDLKAVYTIQTGITETISTVSKIDKAWTEGKLVFNGTSMDEVATTLERYFGKQVLINDELLRSYHLTGTFENNSAEEILYYLSKSKPFTYRITETQIILSAVQ